MAKNFNVVSATFDGQLMGEPMQYRAKGEGQTIEDSAGVDLWNSTSDLVAQRVPCQVMFKDWDNAKTMLTSKLGVTGILTLVTHEAGTVTTKTLTISDVRCVDVDIGAEHKGHAIHVSTFVGIATDGATNPVA